MSNQRTRFILDQQPVRGLHVQLESVWQHIVGQKNYPQPISKALGELLAAGSLLAANLKFDGTFILQVQGTGALKLLVVEATSDKTCRGTARWDENQEIAEDASLTDLLGEQGQFVLTLQPRQGEMWQGIVGLQGDSIAAMLGNYLAQSEQLDSQLILAADGNRAVGLMVQRLPGEELEREDWKYIESLLHTVGNEELLTTDAHTLLYRLFHEQEVRVFEADEVEFACTCSHEKVGNMLLLLGGQEIGQVLLEQGSVEIACDFCQQKYVFDEEDVTDLFGVNVVEAVRHEPKQ
ncbi:heat shock protein Hsp33 [Vitreoscilla sp. C1]|uniref:Hsp33 family molecular chaperone HslO n=1 Tax=Vitreoscilla sp. (strain C1) TaxID=96942 RepID=UPI00148ED9CA|nr:Hsp33 family molecular chaperone HslO [Vitreoscilla sp. C1]QJQ52141.1 heat shock protein Hsp33 [Vitreoscilla sp. C1]